MPKYLEILIQGQPGIYFPIGDHDVSWCRSHTNPSWVIATSHIVASHMQGWGRLQKPDYDFTVPIKLSITITITVVIEKAITITITIIRLWLRLRLQLLVYHGNDSRLFIRHVHLQYYHAWLSDYCAEVWECEQSNFHLAPRVVNKPGNTSISQGSGKYREIPRNRKPMST